MNKHERNWLNYFVASYQRNELQTKRHSDYLGELLDEEERIRLELAKLQIEKEDVLKKFASVMLSNEKKFSSGLKANLEAVRAELIEEVRNAVIRCLELDKTIDRKFADMTCSEAESAAKYVFDKYFMY